MTLSVTSAVLGAVGGMAGVVAGQPLDTIRIRLQQRGNKYSGISHAWKAIVSGEGSASLFKGMGYPLATSALQVDAEWETRQYDNSLRKCT